MCVILERYGLLFSVLKMEFYSTTKKNEILSFAGKWMELETIK
jgi:hypothetical protein